MPGDLTGRIVYVDLHRGDPDSMVEIHVETGGLVTQLWMTDEEASEVLKGRIVDVTFTGSTDGAEA